jgi:glycosyltransferase involved in cell wall biosynthesis
VHIVYINQYFKHPREPGITRSYWIARKLIEAGHRVTMLSHRNVLLNKDIKVPRTERVSVDGIDVIYLRNYYSNKMGVVMRGMTFVFFMLRASWIVLRERDVQMVIATSTPLTVAVPALLRKWARGTPYIFEVRDLWPEVPIQMGAIPTQSLRRLLYWFEKLVYRNAAHVVALSPGMKQGVEKYIPSSKISMIPNMSKIDQFGSKPGNDQLILDMGLRLDSFRVIYFGQMGLSNAIEYVVEAARLWESLDPDIELIFVGHGRMMQYVRDQRDSGRLLRVHLFERVPMKQLSDILSFCDVSLVTFSDLPVLHTNSPNKLFDSLSASLPIIVNSPGWTKEMVETHDCGLFVDPHHASALANAVIWLKHNPEKRNEMSIKARHLAETEYDKSILCERFVNVVHHVWTSLQGACQSELPS